VKLIVGLGNPTKKYKLTRHNVGFLVIDRIAEELSINLRKTSFSSLIGRTNFDGEELLVAKPLTFMNLSGGAVRSISSYKRIDPEDILVVCDDINLGLGRIRIRKSGGSGGHNGLASIIENLDTQEFPRLRIGIGTQNIEDKDLSEYVLEKFSKKELGSIDKILDVATQAVKVFVNESAESAMNKFNDINIG